jgi:hypothetical protein
VAIAQAPLTDAQKRIHARIDEDEVVRLDCDLIRIPSFTIEETPCAEWLTLPSPPMGERDQHKSLSLGEGEGWVRVALNSRIDRARAAQSRSRMRGAVEQWMPPPFFSHSL